MAVPRLRPLHTCRCVLPLAARLTPTPLSLSFQIASSLSKELCALVFGINTFLATVLKTAITLVVSDRRGLGLPVHSQVSPHVGPRASERGGALVPT